MDWFVDSDEDEPISSLLARQEQDPLKHVLFQEESEVQPYASVDFFHALRCIINEGVIHEDFIKRLRHPESIQMLKLLKSRNDRRRETMRAAVRRQDHSVTISISDWVVPYIETIVKGRQDSELLFAGLGKGNTAQLNRLLKTAIAEAGSDDIHRIGTHSKIEGVSVFNNSSFCCKIVFLREESDMTSVEGRNVDVSFSFILLTELSLKAYCTI